MRIALLSNVTVEILAGMLGKRHSVWTPPGFGAWMETALEPPRELRDFDPEAVFLVMDASRSAVDGDAVKSAKSALEDAFPAATVFVPDIEDLADGTGGFYDARMWELGSMPWSLAGLRAIEDEVERLLGLMRGGRRKVLALDFDNTLWAGVIGEDGVGGIRPFEDFQRGIRELQERGVILVGLTRNNAADVEPVWDDPRMALKRGDFAAMRVDWNDKAANLREVARELNLAVDSFVFADDDPVERARMKEACPEVAVPEFPGDEKGLAKFLRRVRRLYFPEMRVTREDALRTAQYRAEAARRDFAGGLSAEKFLEGLGMWADVHLAEAGEFPRIAQLSQKSNQFNVLSNRYLVDDVAGFSRDAGRMLWTVHAGDRFGDQGLVAFVQAVLDGHEATIVDWVMSCRAMNRRLEFAVEERVEEDLLGRGVAKLCASWRKTPKNAPVERLFDGFGFARTGGGEYERLYELEMPRREPLRHYVEFRGSCAANGKGGKP